jgi:hypothetical protein
MVGEAGQSGALGGGGQRLGRVGAFLGALIGGARIAEGGLKRLNG